MTTKTPPLTFHKMAASGNDFVVVDNRRSVVANPTAFAKRVCDRHTGIGADGLLLLESSKEAGFTMRIINSDGSEAEACGNGFRCIALYAHEILGFPSDFKFRSLSGLIDAHVNSHAVKVGLVTPTDYRARKTLHVLRHRLHYSFINTGVPHAVIFVEGLSKMPIVELGRAIRHHQDFQPKGTNVNFVEMMGPHEIDVRTYERGVEDETLACGTGSTASAAVAALSGYVTAPVQVRTRGGEILTVDFKIREKVVSNVTLEGSVQMIFEGKLEP